MKRSNGDNNKAPDNRRYNNNSSVDKEAERFRQRFEQFKQFEQEENRDKDFEKEKEDKDSQPEESYPQEFAKGGNYNPYSPPDKPEDYFTGEKNKKLLVHIVQNGVEVTKPIRKRIYDQQVIWKKRVYPIDIKRAIVDSKGIHHQFVSANDMAILNFKKDHADHCKKCNGKMFIDARNARDLIKRNTIQAIWGIDSTHMILLMVFAVGMMAAVGFAFYSFNQDTLHNTQLKAEQSKNVILTSDNGILRNQTIALQNIINQNNAPDPVPIPRRGE